MGWIGRWMLGLAALLAWGLSPAQAQSNPSLTAFARGIDDGKPHEEAGRVRIRAMRLDARVQGHLADVSIEMEVSTSGSVPDEVRIALALPAEAVVTGYALDVEGRMIPGQLIDQAKARNVYEDEVRKGIDPGLGEVTAANEFRTRIFPVMPGQSRRVRVSFAAPFDPNRTFALPLASADAVGLFEADLRIAGMRETPQVSIGGKLVPLVRDGSGWKGSASARNAVLEGGLTIARSSPDAAMAVTRHSSGELFFAIGDSLAGPRGGYRPIKGGRLRVYWDRSLSRRDDLLDKERDLLRRIVGEMTPDGIDLVTFASDAPKAEPIAGMAALDRALDGVSYRGGTSFAGLDGLRLAEARRCLMFTDGLPTLDQASEFAPDCALTIVASAPEADGARLGRLTQSLGGEFVRLTVENGAELATRLIQSRAKLVSARDVAGNRLRYRALASDMNSWLLTGPLPDSGSVRLRIADFDGRIVERVYEAREETPTSHDAAGALWAAARVNELGDDPAEHRRMVQFSRRYSVAGPQMSFLVLESPQQYLEADILPPAGYPDAWMGRYRDAKAAFDSSQRAAKEQRFQFVLNQWRERKSWWERHYTARKRVVREETDSVGGASDDESIVVTSQRVTSRPSRSNRDSAPLPPPPPPPPPPPVVAPVADAAQVAGQARERRPEAVRQEESMAPGDLHRREGRRPIGLELGKLASDQPYIAALERAAPAERLKVLADEELKFGATPAFYLDTAEWFRLKGDRATADLLLFSALELASSNDETRQIVAFRLERDASFERSVDLMERFAAGSTYRPQPKRSLALALAARGRAKGQAGKADLERAFRLLTEAALEPAKGDFDGLEVISLMDANALLPSLRSVGGSWELDERLTGLLDTDVRIVIEWTNDDADIDLWIDEPNGERVYYGDKLSSSGGQISNDMTDGYGPEEYAIRRAPQGEYKVRINGFDADRINPNGHGHVLVRLIRDFGRSNEQATLVDADMAFQTGSNRNQEERTRPVATLRVGR